MTTLASVQTVLANRLYDPLQTVEMAVHSDGVNQDMQDSIAWALHILEIAPADPLIVTDVDLALVPNESVYDFVDLAEFRLLKTIVQRMTQTDERLGPHGKWAGQYPTRLNARLTAMQEQFDKKYGVNVATLEFGVIPTNGDLRGE
jgi:hypothetical protein